MGGRPYRARRQRRDRQGRILSLLPRRRRHAGRKEGRPAKGIPASRYRRSSPRAHRPLQYRGRGRYVAGQPKRRADAKCIACRTDNGTRGRTPDKGLTALCPGVSGSQLRQTGQCQTRPDNVRLCPAAKMHSSPGRRPITGCATPTGSAGQRGWGRMNPPKCDPDHIARNRLGLCLSKVREDRSTLER
jgi:hypothetical protein